MPSPKSLSELADQADQRLAREGAMKASRGEKISSRERSAMKRVAKVLHEQKCWEIYGAIPKRHYLDMCGRQAKVVNDQARRYKLPLMGRTLDLPAILRAFHDLLAMFAKRLTLGDEDDFLLAGPVSPALEEWRTHRARLAAIEVEERLGNLISREEIHELLVRLADRQRQFGEILQERFGPEAHALLVDLWEDYQHELDRSFGGDRERGDDPD